MILPRIRLFIVAVLLVATGNFASIARAQQSDSNPRADNNQRTEEIVDKALTYLSTRQNNDGSFSDGGPKSAMTALATMAYLSAGHVPESGKFGLVVRRSVDYLVGQAPEDGYFGKLDGSRMYGHGIITVALCEAYGVEPDPVRREKLCGVIERAMSVILKAQDVRKPEALAGGWRYEPQSSDSDLSLSGWNTLALRAAAGIGLTIPKEHVERARRFVLQCYHKQRKGFCYQPGQDATATMTGVAVLNLHLMDAGETPEVKGGEEFLVRNPLHENTRFEYYALYYTTSAAHQAGDATWAAVWKVTQAALLTRQQPDGGFPQSKSGEEPGRVYATSMSVMTLTVPWRLLPIYQR